MAKKKDQKEQGIFLLMMEEEALDFIENVVFTTMKKHFSAVKYAVILIEQEDNIKEMLRNFQPRAFIFDNELNYFLNGIGYKSYGLMQRLTNQFPDSVGMMFTKHDIFGECNGLLEGKKDENFSNVFWFKKLNGAKKNRPGMIAGEKVLKMAFVKKKQ